MRSNLLELLGVALVLAGVAAVSAPVALIVAGVALVAWCEFGAGGDL